MRGSLWEGLLIANEPRLKPPYSPACFGEKIATLDSGQDCWEVTGTLREQYYSKIHPKLCEQLFAIFGTSSLSDWITFPVYMVGHHRLDALPTIMICSEDETARKKAKKELKKSDFLKRHARFKIMSVSEDPGMHSLEQLASDQSGEKALRVRMRARKVLIDRSKPLQPLGMEIWVDHGSSLRPATAFVSQINGRIFIRTVSHAFTGPESPTKFVERVNKRAVHVDSDSDSDSEPEDEDNDVIDVTITSIGSKSPDMMSDTGSSSDSSLPSILSSGKSTPRMDEFEDRPGKIIPLDLQEVSSRLMHQVSLSSTFPLKQITQPPEEKLESLGVLVEWSVDKDWALIEITNKDYLSVLEQSLTGNIMKAKTTPELQANAEIFAYTSSGGRLTGTLSGTPFCMRLPKSTSFQDVYRVQLNEALANGDCGSAVRDAVSGELYGHIIAGCKATGTAYIMASYLIDADFRNLVLTGSSDLFPEVDIDKITATAPSSTAEKHKRSRQTFFELALQDIVRTRMPSARFLYRNDYPVEKLDSSRTQEDDNLPISKRKFLHDFNYYKYLRFIGDLYDVFNEPSPLILGFLAIVYDTYVGLYYPNDFKFYSGQALVIMVVLHSLNILNSMVFQFGRRMYSLFATIKIGMTLSLFPIGFQLVSLITLLFGPETQPLDSKSPCKPDMNVFKHIQSIDWPVGSPVSFLAGFVAVFIAVVTASTAMPFVLSTVKALLKEQKVSENKGGISLTSSSARIFASTFTTWILFDISFADLGPDDVYVLPDLFSEKSRISLKSRSFAIPNFLNHKVWFLLALSSWTLDTFSWMKWTISEPSFLHHSGWLPWTTFLTEFSTRGDLCVAMSVLMIVCSVFGISLSCIDLLSWYCITRLIFSIVNTARQKLYLKRNSRSCLSDYEENSPPLPHPPIIRIKQTSNGIRVTTSARSLAAPRGNEMSLANRPRFEIENPDNDTNSSSSSTYENLLSKSEELLGENEKLQEENGKLVEEIQDLTSKINALGAGEDQLIAQMRDQMARIKKLEAKIVSPWTGHEGVGRKLGILALLGILAAFLWSDLTGLDRWYYALTVMQHVMAYLRK